MVTSHIRNHNLDGRFGNINGNVNNIGLGIGNSAGYPVGATYTTANTLL